MFKKLFRIFYTGCVICILSLLSLLPAYARTIHVLTFNVQNLFDGVKSGEEYPEYRPPRWNKNSYEHRLISIGKALQTVDYPLDVIILQEVENRTVVEDLRTYYLPAFKHIAVTDNTYGAIELAIMSKHSITSVNTHTLRQRTPNRQFRTLRPLLDVSISFSLPPYKRVQILAVHLKSKRKTRGGISSDKIRAHQYKLIVKVIDTSVPSIIAGDFNDTMPQNTLTKHGATIIASSISTYKNAQDHRGQAIRGTYYYQSQWQQIDHVLIDAVLNSAVKNKANVIVAKKPFITDKGLPNRFNKHKGLSTSAVSDHLPLVFFASW